MLKLGFVFLLGGIVGGAVVLGLGAYEASHEGDGAEVNAGAAAPVVKRPRPRDVAELSPEATDAELAGYLTLAGFDRDWEHVSEVAEILRERAATKPVADDAGEVAAVDSARNLAGLDHDYRERIAEVELAGRDNPATRLVRSQRTPEQITQGLTELL
ncbi:MAG: hypothetical protein KDD82_16675, partial [Planctomycetes bacterium]|nr:hypothetical protein [Planctomycetota bacterium]